MPPSPEVYRAGSLIYTKRTLAILFLWLLWGDFCFVLMETVVPSIMPLKFKALGTPNAVMGLVITTIPGIINSFCNPIISFKSDRYRSRWGRRIPFILFTLPLLVLCLVALGFSTQIAFWLHNQCVPFLSQFDPNTVAIAIAGGAMALFSFFNTFVNSVFWYLFNDVVPEFLLARFMSWFRTVSLGAGALYNLFIFKHAATHSTEILVGVGVLYLVGFGAMCLNVKEGNYPPPPENVDGRTGLVGAIKTYARECMGYSHYWWLFLGNMGIAISAASGLFWIFLQQSMGLSYELIGRLGFAVSITGAIAIPFSGWLADRYHPLRIVLIGLVLQLIVTPLSLVWLFWQPPTHTVFFGMIALNALIGAPIACLVAVMDPPVLMRIFPRERYGQFCSANSMCRSVASIAGGLLVGICLDMITKHWGANVAYRLLPLWNFLAFGVVLFATTKLYRSWKRYGGDTYYVPPVPHDEAPVSNSVG